MLKGDSVEKLRAAASSILEKVDTLLTTNPVRMIGYGATVAAFLAAKFLADMGYARFDITFEQAVAITATSLTFVTIVVEAARRFVYAPQTYIEDLADEWMQGHAEAHIEQMFQRMLAARAADAAAAAAASAPVIMPIGIVPDGKPN